MFAANGGLLETSEIVGNAADVGVFPNGGGIDLYFGGTIRNCIIYFNTAGGGPNYTGSGSIASCCTTPDPGGTDARGFRRFVDGDAASAGVQLDIGAVEAGPLRTVSSLIDGNGNALRNQLSQEFSKLLDA